MEQITLRRTRKPLPSKAASALKLVLVSWWITRY